MLDFRLGRRGEERCRARPTHGAWWPSDLFEQGVGWVIVARFKSGGRRVEAGISLVDVPCMGVKLAVYEDTTEDDFRRRILDHYGESFPILEAGGAE